MLGNLENGDWACFEGKFIKSPLELVCYLSSFFQYWAGFNLR
jgi:hypothetical protein